MSAAWPTRARPEWLAAAMGLVVAVLAFYPGYMSWDSAYQWWQARHDQFDPTHPPLMAMLWQVTDRVLPGPGGMFLVQQLLLWTALGAFASALPCRPRYRVACVLVLGLWPPLFGLSAFLWKDLWTLGAFSAAAALLVHDLARPSRPLRVAALLCLVLACAFRHNAITGALPLVLWVALRERGQDSRRGLAWVAAVTLVLSSLVWAAAKLPELDGRVRPVDSVWSVVTLWDAAAVSLREGRLVYPPELVQADLTLAELREHFVDYSNGTVFHTGKLDHSFDGPYTDAQRQALRQLAIDLPTRYPASYFGHRLRVAELLYGWDRPGLPDGQVMWPILHAFEDNPPLNVTRSPFQTWIAARLMALVDSPWFAGWIYLAAAVGLLVLGWARRTQPLSALSGLLAASSLAYALPLALASGSAEFRYLAWPLLACLMAGVLASTHSQPSALAAP